MCNLVGKTNFKIVKFVSLDPVMGLLKFYKLKCRLPIEFKKIVYLHFNWWSNTEVNILDYIKCK